jgi:hypothetical protein
MRINVDTTSINDYSESANNYRLLVNDNNELEVVDYDSYNDFISDHILVDVDASYGIENPNTGEIDYLAYQHPTPRVELVDQGKSRSTTSPDLSPANTNENAGKSASEAFGEEFSETRSQDPEQTENNQESEVDGDTKDTRTNAGDAQSSSPIMDPRERWEATKEPDPNTEEQEFDENLERIAEKVANGEELTDLEQSIRNDYADQIDPMVAEMTESYQYQYESITEGVGQLNNQSSQDLKQLKLDLENLLEDMLSEPYQNLTKEEDALMNEIEDMIDDIGVELTGRNDSSESDPQGEEDSFVPESLNDQLADDLGSLSQRTPTRDRDISETTDSDETIEKEATNNNDYNCIT